MLLYFGVAKSRKLIDRGSRNYTSQLSADGWIPGPEAIWRENPQFGLKNLNFDALELAYKWANMRRLGIQGGALGSLKVVKAEGGGSGRGLYSLTNSARALKWANVRRLGIQGGALGSLKVAKAEWRGVLR